MNGALEPTNSPYAMAKLTSIELGRSLKIQYGHKIVNLMSQIYMDQMIIFQKKIVMLSQV